MKIHLKRYLLGCLLFFIVIMLTGPINSFISKYPVGKMTATVLDSLPIEAEPAYGFAWNDNVGWINFGTTTTHNNGQVYISNNELYGYAWGENIGWISMNCKNEGTCGTSQFAVTQNDSNGILTGYAWGENIGWINFNPAGGGVTITTNTSGVNTFSGYAWGENIGWISFSGTSPDYGVSTTWTKPKAAIITRVSSVSINPKTQTINPGETVQFTANVSVSGGASRSVAWSIDDNDNGTVSNDGLYTAGTTTGTFHVKVTSNFDAAKNDSATITITKAPIPIKISAIIPANKNVYGESTTTFSATISGTSSDDINWSILEGPLAGHITLHSGIYTATTTPGTYHIIATSVASSSVSASTSITVIPRPISIKISPKDTETLINKTVQFTADVIGTSTDGVSWIVAEEDAGTIDENGLYTAPKISGVFHIIGKSIADISKTDVATVTVRLKEIYHPISVTISPKNSEILVNGVQQFTADVSGTSTGIVSWIVADEAGGTIDDSGLYTAPNIAGIFHIIAKSIDNINLADLATITVRLKTLPPKEATTTATTTSEQINDSQNPVTGPSTGGIGTIGNTPGGAGINIPSGGTSSATTTINNGSSSQSIATSTNTASQAVIQSINDVRDIVVENVAVLGTTTKVIIAQAKMIVESPVGSVVTKTVSTAGVVGGGIAVSSAIALNPVVASEIFLVPFRLWTLLLGVLGLKRRSKPWGTVYDSVTKQPLDPAYVVIQDENGKEINMSITDLDGRYGFLTTPGKYKIIANKTNYTFPSKKLAGRKSDEIYHDLYFGETLNIEVDNAVIYKNIPLDPDKFDWNEFMKTKKGLNKFYSQRDRLVTSVTNWFFRIGFLISIISLILVAQPYNLIIFAFYIFLALLRKFGLKQKTYGNLLEKSGEPLSFAIVRVMSPDLNVEISSRAADKIGRYYCLVPKGKYYVKIEKKEADGSYALVYTSPVFETKNGIINQSFNI